MHVPVASHRPYSRTLVALAVVLSLPETQRAAEAHPQSFDDPALAGVGDAADAAELIPAAASGLPPVLPGQPARPPAPAGRPP